MRYLLQGFGAVIGCALVSFGWTGFTTAIHPARRAKLKLPYMPPKGGPTALAVGSLAFAGLGASLLFAVLAWQARR